MAKYIGTSKRSVTPFNRAIVGQKWPEAVLFIDEFRYTDRRKNCELCRPINDLKRSTGFVSAGGVINLYCIHCRARVTERWIIVRVEQGQNSERRPLYFAISTDKYLLEDRILLLLLELRGWARNIQIDSILLLQMYKTNVGFLGQDSAVFLV